MKRTILPTVALMLFALPALAADQDQLATTMDAAFRANAAAAGNLENAARVAMQQRAQLQAMLMRAIELCGDRCTELTTPERVPPTLAQPPSVDVKPEVAAPAK